MAKAKLTLDKRTKSKDKMGLYPIVFKIFHLKPRMIRTEYFTSINGWDEKNMVLRKSIATNKNLDCNKINHDLYDKLHIAKSLINNLGLTINKINVDVLVENIKKSWDQSIDYDLKNNLSNSISLNEWSQVLIDRKLREQKPSTAKWYKDSISALTKFNNNENLKFFELTVTKLKEFELEHRTKGNSVNGISAYIRAIRAIYNSALKEDIYIPEKNPFLYYKIPSTQRTKKKALPKQNFNDIRKLRYPVDSNLWHVKNYVLCMFNCRGMNLIDLAKLKVKDVQTDRLIYGRSKTGEELSVKLTVELLEILKFYRKDKKNEDYIFPIGYDGSVENFTKYRSDRRLVNKLLKKIADDAGIEERITSYYIRHSWATIAKNLGIPIEVISEGLGHHSLKTTEIYLKSFDNAILDDANELVVS